MHCFYDFDKAVGIFDLLLNILNLFPILTEAVVCKRSGYVIGLVIEEAADRSCNLLSLIVIKLGYLFFGEIFALLDKLVNALCDLRPFE